MLEKFFHISSKGSTLRREIVAGLTTFFSMAYIIFVNPNTLCANIGTGAEPFYPAMPGELWGPVLVATCVAAAIGCILTGLIVNVPFAMAPGMGLNAYFTYTVCLGMGYTWQEGLAIVLMSGLLFLLVMISPLREKILSAIPDFLRYTISAGIGLFIALIGLMNVGLVNIDGAIPALTLYQAGEAGTQWNMQGILALLGLVITAVLMVKKVKGAIVIGILVITVIGIPFGVTNLPESVSMSNISLAPVFLQMDFAGAINKGLLPLITVVISFAMVDCFDTLGGVLGLTTGLDPEDAKDHKRLSKVMLMDSIATCTGALVGTSTVTTYAESSTGIAEGGRTGLTPVITGVLFLVSMLLAPIAGIIPSAATAPALIMVGVLIMGSVAKVAWDKVEYAIPSFLTLAGIPFFYSISDGIALGFFSHCVIQLVLGKGKSVSPVIYGITVLFILKYVLGFVAS